MCAKSLQSCLTLCNPMDCTLPGPSVHRILQARILENSWVAMPFSRGSSQPRDQIHISYLLHWQAGSLPLAPPGKLNHSHTHTHTDTHRHTHTHTQRIRVARNPLWETLLGYYQVRNTQSPAGWTMCFQSETVPQLIPSLLSSPQVETAQHHPP